MAAINEVTNLEVESNIAILTLNSPPVNALSANVREGLHVGVKQAIEDENVKADDGPTVFAEVTPEFLEPAGEGGRGRRGVGR